MKEESPIRLKPEYTIVKSPNNALSSTITTADLRIEGLKGILAVGNTDNIFWFSKEVLQQARSLDSEKQKKAIETLSILFREAKVITAFHEK